MRTAMRSILAFALFMAAAPAYSSELIHMYRCEQEDEVSEDDILAQVQKWLAAARKTKGGEGLQAQVLFPVAVNAPGEIDFLIAIRAPSFAQWGVFWDNYQDSPVADVEEQIHLTMVCPDSALWQVEKIEVKPQ